jgi:hypothetical protein
MDEEGAKRERMEVESRLVFGAEIGYGCGQDRDNRGDFCAGSESNPWIGC